MRTIVLVLPINITKLQKEFQKQIQLNFIKKLRKAHIFTTPYDIKTQTHFLMYNTQFLTTE